MTVIYKVSVEYIKIKFKYIPNMCTVQGYTTSW